MDLKSLKAPFPHNVISWRVGATNKEKTKGIALAYIDARDVMERLDEVCGAENWQDRYTHAGDKTICEIGIRIDGEWIWKSNGAGDTQIEAEKGAISDAFKRAAVMWGIGRYLYDCPNVWVELDQYKKIKNPNDPRLNEALKKAESGARPIAETVVKSEDEKRKSASQWVAQQTTLLNTFNTRDELLSWSSANEKYLTNLSNYPDLEKTMNGAYQDRMSAVKEAA